MIMLTPAEYLILLQNQKKTDNEHEAEQTAPRITPKPVAVPVAVAGCNCSKKVHPE